jgi:hypothetical protein
LGDKVLFFRFRLSTPPLGDFQLPAAICFPGLILSVRFRSNGSDRGIPLRARAPNAMSRLSVPFAAAHHSRSDFPRPILIEWLGPLGPPSDASDPLRTHSDPFGPPPSDLDRTARTSSDPLGPARIHVAVCFPLVLGPLGQRVSPPVVDTPWPACQRSPARVRAPSAANLISAVGFRSDG